MLEELTSFSCPGHATCSTARDPSSVAAGVRAHTMLSCISSLHCTPITKLQYLSHVSSDCSAVKQLRPENPRPDGQRNREIPRVPTRRSTHSTPSPQCVSVQSSESVEIWARDITIESHIFMWARLPVTRSRIVLLAVNYIGDWLIAMEHLVGWLQQGS